MHLIIPQVTEVHIFLSMEYFKLVFNVLVGSASFHPKLKLMQSGITVSA